MASKLLFIFSDTMAIPPSLTTVGLPSLRLHEILDVARPNTARKAEKEKKKQEAAAKALAKKEAAAKVAAASGVADGSKASRKDKEKPMTNAKLEAAKQAEFVNTTPHGEKKGQRRCCVVSRLCY